MADEESAVEEAVDPLTLFPEQWREPVAGLLYLGQLSETADFCGHQFGLKTLLPHEKLAIGSAMQPYRNTVMEPDAFQYAHVGLALTSIDGDEAFCPVSMAGIDAFARARLNWVAKNIYPPTIEFLWARYSLLEATAALGVRELDRLSRGSQPNTSPPWLDSLIDLGSSPDATDSDTPPSISSK